MIEYFIGNFALGNKFEYFPFLLDKIQVDLFWIRLGQNEWEEKQQWNKFIFNLSLGKLLKIIKKKIFLRK